LTTPKFGFSDDGSKFMLFGYEVVPHVISILIVTVTIVILALFINKRVKNADPREKPKGLLLFAEMFVTMINKLVKDIMGEKLMGMAPYIGFLAAYLFLSNILGLFGFTPPTANITVTATLGILTFLLIQINGIRFNGFNRIKSWFEPHWIMFPVNIVGELALPVSLSFRIFGNILGGAIIMTILYGAIGMGISALVGLTGVDIGRFGELFASPITAVFHVYFDLFAGVIQTMIFVLLTSIFISLASEQ
jgi:F-type H+-transporting ATPase subunit a